MKKLITLLLVIVLSPQIFASLKFSKDVSNCTVLEYPRSRLHGNTNLVLRNFFLVEKKSMKIDKIGTYDKQNINILYDNHSNTITVSLNDEVIMDIDHRFKGSFSDRVYLDSPDTIITLMCKPASIEELVKIANQYFETSKWSFQK